MIISVEDGSAASQVIELGQHQRVRSPKNNKGIHGYGSMLTALGREKESDRIASEV